MFFPKTDNLRNYVTPKRTDHLKQVKVAGRGALLSCAQTVADETVDGVLPLPRFEFYEQITRTILDVESDNDEVFQVKFWVGVVANH